jgi:hypothetical protein
MFAPADFIARTCPGVASPRRSPIPAEVSNPIGLGFSQSRRERNERALA